MIKKITHVCYAEDNINEQYLFSRALDGLSTSRTLKVHYSCTLLMAYLDDTTEPLPDMIFLDYDITGESAKNCVKLIKGNAKLLNIPIVMFHPSEENRTLNNPGQAGVYKYLVKPVDFKEARAGLQKVFSEYENGSA